MDLLDEGSEKNEQKEDKEEKKKTKKRGRTSYAWSYLVEKGEHVVCEVMISTPLGITTKCGKKIRFKYSDGSESLKQAKEHLTRAHKITNAKSGGVAKVIAGGGDALPAQEKWSRQSEQTKKVVNMIAKWFAIDRLPPHNVTKAGFNAFLERVYPKFPGVSETTVGVRVRELGEDFKAWFKELLRSVGFYAITTDGWTSDAKDGYRCVTLHLLTEEKDYASFLLASRPCGRDADAVSALLTEVLDEFDLDRAKCVACVTDSCATEIAALNIAGITRVSCVNHWVNLPLKSVSFKGKPAKPPRDGRPAKPAKPASPTASLMSRYRSVAAYFHNSANAKDALEADMEASKTDAPYPVLENETRWSSQYAMLKSVVDLRPNVERSFRALRRAKQKGLPTELTDEDWTAGEQLRDILAPFADFASRMQTAGPLISTMLGEFWTFCFFPTFYHNPGENFNLVPCVREWKKQLKAQLEARFRANVMDSELILAASGLDPLYKQLTLPGNFPQSLRNDVIPRFIVGEAQIDNELHRTRMVNRQHDQCYMAIVAQLKRLGLENGDELQQVHAPQQTSKADALLALTVAGYSGKQKTTNQQVTASQEAKSWFETASHSVQRDTDRVQWWKQYGEQWPRLQKLALILLPVPITAAPSERNWSSAEYISGDRRSNMAADTMEATLLVSSNVGTRAKMTGKGVFECMEPQKPQKRKKK